MIEKYNTRITGRERPVKTPEEVQDRLNDMIAYGISLEKGLSGEILDVSLPAGQSLIVSHGLRATPLYRIILRQTGEATIEDLDEAWTDRSVGFVNNSANDVTAKIGIYLR